MQDVVTPTSDLNAAQRAQQVRDLRSRIAELNAEDEREVVFKEPPKVRKTTIYSLADGEPLMVPIGSVHRVLTKRNPDGTYMFTANKEEAPEYKLGDVKCFLHPQSIERLSGELEAAGIAGIPCDSAHHPSRYAMEEIARSKHRKQWEALERHRAREEARVWNERQEQQLQATLALAGKAAGAPEAADGNCDLCDYVGSPAQVRGHKMGAHKEKAE